MVDKADKPPSYSEATRPAVTTHTPGAGAGSGAGSGADPGAGSGAGSGADPGAGEDAEPGGEISLVAENPPPSYSEACLWASYWV